MQQNMESENINHKMQQNMESENINPPTLDHVLNKIFLGTPEKRLGEIREILMDEQIFTGKDFLIVDTNELREKQSFSDAEILKIEQYIRQNNPDWYGDIRTENLLKHNMKFMELKGNKELELLILKQNEKVKFLALKKDLENQLKALEIKKQEEIKRLKYETTEQIKHQEITISNEIKAIKKQLADIESQIINDDVLLQSLTFEKQNLMKEKFDLEMEVIRLKQEIAKKENQFQYKLFSLLGIHQDSKSKLNSELEDTINRLQDKSNKIIEVDNMIRNMMIK